MIEDIRRRHLRLLKNAFDFAQADDLSWSRGAKDAFDLEVKTVKELVAQRIPCGPTRHDVLELFLERQWSPRGDFPGLWQMYVDAGYVDPNGFVHLKWKGELVRAAALEAAIVLKNPVVLQSLLKAGARVDAIPTQEWKASKRSKKTAVKDIEGFLKLVVKDATKRSELQVLLLESAMAARIERAVAARPTPPPRQPAASGSGTVSTTQAPILELPLDPRLRRRRIGL